MSTSCVPALSFFHSGFCIVLHFFDIKGVTRNEVMVLIHHSACSRSFPCMLQAIFPVMPVATLLHFFRIHADGKQESLDDCSTLNQQFMDAGRHVKPWVMVNKHLSSLHGVLAKPF